VRAPRQLAQHAGRIGIVVGLAEDGAAQGHRGVRAQHGRRRQAALLQAGQCGIELQAGDAPHVARRRLAGQHRLDGFRVLARLGQQQLVAHAQLLQQLAAARALGREVDEVTHGGTDGWR
jgi:hypothetical protein